LIFVCLGTHNLPFDRLLIKVDELIEKNVICDEVIAQVGYSTYQPKNFKAVKFVQMDEFNTLVGNSNYVITHGGTGSITSALGLNKKVIAIPRLQRYGEHLDDHQIEIIKQFSEKGHIIAAYSVDDLEDAIASIEEFTPVPFKSGTEKIISIIEDFINSIK